MIAIKRVETILIDVPTIRPHILAMATMYQQTLCIIRIHCADGVVGIGEATTISGLAYGPESPEGIKLSIDSYFTPILKTCDAERPAAVMALLSKHIVGNNFAKCAVETALLDAMGKRIGVAVSELLGGRLRDAMPVLWTLASGDTARDIDEAQSMIDTRRHNLFKLKIGKRDLADDVAHVAAIKRALGTCGDVRVDVNMAWDEPTAQTGIAMLADVGCSLVEQPIAAHNIDGMVRLCARATIPIMADEALRGPADAYAFASRAAANVFAVKIEQSGGLHAARQVQAVADSSGVALYGGTMLEAGVGTIASAHVFATFPRLAFGTELFGPLLLTEDILQQPLAYSDFSLAVPDGPGLGISLDEDRVAFFRRDGARKTIGIPSCKDV